MAKPIYVALVLIFASQNFALASDLDAHGSDAIVCRDTEGHIKSAELFDYYEGRVLRDIAIDVGSSSKDVKDAIEILFKRLAQLSPQRVNDYRKGAEEFLRDAYFLSGQEFPNIEENDPVAVPIGCREEKAVLQKLHGLPGDNRYTVNREIWNAMSAESKAGLIFHELLFARFVPKDHSGLSRSEFDHLRYFNEVLASSEALSALNTDQKVMNHFQLINSSYTDIRGVRFAIEGAQFYANGALLTASMMGHATLSISGQNVSVYEITYFDDGTIKSVKLVFGFHYKDPATNLDFKDEVEFHPGGRIRKGTLATDSSGYIDPRTGLRYNETLTFDPSGALLSGYVSQLSKTNAYDLYSSHTQAELDENGQVARWNAWRANGWVAIGGYPVKCSPIGNQFTFSNDGAITRVLWDGNCPIPVQNIFVKVRYNFPVELKSNQHIRAITPSNGNGWIELLAGSGDHVKQVKWRTQEFTPRPGAESVYPEIRFHDGDLDILASGYLYEKTRLLLSGGGEKDFEALTWVQLNRDGEVVDWKVQ